MKSEAALEMFDNMISPVANTDSQLRAHTNMGTESSSEAVQPPRPAATMGGKSCCGPRARPSPPLMRCLAGDARGTTRAAFLVQVQHRRDVRAMDGNKSWWHRSESGKPPRYGKETAKITKHKRPNTSG